MTTEHQEIDPLLETLIHVLNEEELLRVRYRLSKLRAVADLEAIVNEELSKRGGE